MVVSGSDTPLVNGKERTSKILPQETPTASPNQSGRQTYLLAIALHIVLVIIHLIIVAIHFPHKHENRINVARGTRSNEISVVIIAVLEVFIIVYLAVLVYLMQKLSFRKSVAIRQTLTAVHDKHAAWSGSGAAVATLYRQIRLRTAFPGLFFVVLYVFGVAALHVTTPALMSLVTSDRPSPGFALIKSSRPDFLEAIIGPAILSDSISLLPALRLLQSSNATAGLYGNILYDTPTFVYRVGRDGLSVERSLASEFQVPNATLFNVTCGNLAGVEQVGAGNATSWFLKTPVRNVTDGNYNPLRVFDPYAIRFIPQEYFTENQKFASQTLLLVASVNITDSEGNNGSTFAVNPPFNPIPMNWTEVGDLPRTFDPIVIACSLVSSRTNVNIDPVSKIISRDSIEAAPRKTFRLWSPWTEPTKSDDPLVQSWASIFLEASPSPVIATTCVDPLQYPDRQPQCQTKDYLTIVEKYVNDALHIRPVSQISGTTYNNSVHLHDLENILENLTAAAFWNEANFPATALDFTTGSQFQDSWIDVMVYDPNVLLLTVNVAPLGIGLCCSVGLLCIALYLLRWPKDASVPADLNGIGLLQFIWLLGSGSDVQTKVAAVTQPSTDNLRAAGMTEITPSTLALRDLRKRRSDKEG
ncbi:hypothetical protein C8R45DRAFT_899920 [Mycena sanguinolenta]|nr:hypothetical protein C8R45DRAFT_899920 [Mycena sanguinolenta]